MFNQVFYSHDDSTVFKSSHPSSNTNNSVLYELINEDNNAEDITYVDASKKPGPRPSACRWCSSMICTHCRFKN